MLKTYLHWSSDSYRPNLMSDRLEEYEADTFKEGNKISQLTLLVTSFSLLPRVWVILTEREVCA